MFACNPWLERPYIRFQTNFNLSVDKASFDVFSFLLSRENPFRLISVLWVWRMSVQSSSCFSPRKRYFRREHKSKFIIHFISRTRFWINCIVHFTFSLRHNGRSVELKLGFWKRRRGMPLVTHSLAFHESTTHFIVELERLGRQRRRELEGAAK